MTTTAPSTATVAAVRGFSRFYTRHIGALQDHLLGTDCSLAEARVLFELAHHGDTTAKQLGEELGIDPGYMSRILARLRERSLISQVRSAQDGRQRILKLTAAGRKTFATLDRRSHDQIQEMLEPLWPEERARLVGSMQTIQQLLGKPAAPNDTPLILRPLQSGDLGWLIERHGILYREAHGWGEEFEAQVARILADFVDNYSHKEARSWIVERDGERLGSAFVSKETGTVAHLRLLLVEPRARGMGIGTRLVDECVRFARQAGYQRMLLLTNSAFTEARRLYERVGFEIVDDGRYRDRCHKFANEAWEMALAGG